jgi:hypothetical protein
VRIGSGLGFYGDAWEPVLASIERGGVQYIASDHLSELTLAILQKDRQRDASLGYARDVLPMLMRLWPAMRAHGVKLVCNAGGLNPRGAADTLRVALATRGWNARIAVVTGDDVLPTLLSPAGRRPCAPVQRRTHRPRCASGSCSPTRTWARGPSSMRCAKAPTSCSPAVSPTPRSVWPRWCTNSAGRWRTRPPTST